MSVISDIKMYWRLAFGLRRFLRETVTMEQSREIIKSMMEKREENFLAVLRRAVYENERSPYLKLLRLAGCEYGDVESMVRADGLEPTLHKLREKGVYISYEEFKGRKEVVRGGEVFKFKESDFDNPFLSAHIEARTGATRSAGTRTMFDFAFLSAIAPMTVVVQSAHGLWESPVLIWFPILPASSGILYTLAYAKIGKPPLKWFSQVEEGTVKPPLRKRLATYYVVYAGRLFGSKLPKPEYVGLSEAYRVAEYVSEVLKMGSGCVLLTYPSSAVRVCRAAREKGLDITGATFRVAGEPLTEAKRREIEAAGCRVLASYGFSEAGVASQPCPNPIAPDDTHLRKDVLALIQCEREIELTGTTVGAFLFTSISPAAPKILLNVEIGDYGVLEARHCGCELEKLGFTDHIYNIRSFEKLTGEGMTFIGTDLLRIIEEVLPAKFGGASTDYQIVEEEEEGGLTRLSILVSPDIGPIDEEALVATVLSELGKGTDTQRMMANIWSQANILRVKRMRPIATVRGKLFPLHIEKGKQSH